MRQSEATCDPDLGRKYARSVAAGVDVAIVCVKVPPFLLLLELLLPICLLLRTGPTMRSLVLY